jgi:ABC-2 type transport system permease protein
MLIGLLVGGTLGSSWPLRFLISTLGNLIFLSLGFAIAGRVGSVDAANNMAGLATTPLMFLSGSFFPIDSMPGWLQPVADLLPLTPLIDSMRAVALQGAGIADIGSELALIGAWIVVGLGLARAPSDSARRGTPLNIQKGARQVRALCPASRVPRTR